VNQPEQTGERSQVQVIARAAAILRALEHEKHGLSLGQIARSVGLARSTVQRIVGALQEEKLLVAASPNGRMRLGPALLRLAASVDTDLARIARPFIAELSSSLGETVDLAAVRRDQVVFVDQIVGPQRLRAVSAVGEAFPLYCTANGKAHLARLAPDEIERLLGPSFPPRTPHTHTRIEHLLDELEQVRRLGFALDQEEHTLGISAAGVALADALGNPIAISVPVPTPRFRGRENAIAEGLLATKRALAERFRAEAA
jgi:DNA-binding IclR family transcriptional regulator